MRAPRIGPIPDVHPPRHLNYTTTDSLDMIPGPSSNLSPACARRIAAAQAISINTENPPGSGLAAIAVTTEEAIR